MIARLQRARSGITLTEILISIMIMGVGMISLAVLFPVGLLRLQWAGRLSRSAYLGESAIDDISTRGLFNSASFTNTNYSPWYSGVNPWISDTVNFPGGVVRSVGPGLPVAYDPLWRYQTGGGYYNFTPGADARFGSGMGVISAHAGLTSGTTTYPDTGPSVYGLQRLTNFNPALFNGTSNPVLDTFISPEDVVFQGSESVEPNSVNVSPVVPDLSIPFPGTNTPSGLPTNDWRYTWFFTGQQTDANNTTVFNGSIIVCENREFNYETINVGGTSVPHVAGETTVEGIFGYSQNVVLSSQSAAPAGFAVAATNTVVLRWPASMDDPDVKVGGWIADVTYERTHAADTGPTGKFTGTLQAYPQISGAIPEITIPPMQRCYWYQVAKKSPVGPDVLNPASSAYRSMTVWTVTPLRAQTLLSQPSGTTPAQPVFANAALIMPSVVNVYAHTFYTH